MLTDMPVYLIVLFFTNLKRKYNKIELNTKYNPDHTSEFPAHV